MANIIRNTASFCYKNRCAVRPVEATDNSTSSSRTHPPNFFTPSLLPRELRPFVVLPPAALEAHRVATQVVPGFACEPDESVVITI